MLQSVTTPASIDRQRTLASEATVAGRGLFGGAMVEARIAPAPPDAGIAFERTALDPPVRIAATVDHSVPRARRTAIREGDVSIDTVEHCLS
ncbi:MAG: UDP-3-O-acyl-N-acetylglucosamine deacetylase, partial [Phycisphaerales bacterium]